MQSFIVSLIAFIFSTTISIASPISCAVNLPLGIPTVKENVKLICKTAFITAYDYSAKIPSWVAYNVSHDHAVGCAVRSHTFYVERGVPASVRAHTKDYRKSGYDTGHLADAASMSYDPQVSVESFTLSNTAPQNPGMNRGIWSNLELHVRSWAFNGRSLTVYTGGIYNNLSKKIGSGVVVPDKFFKIVIDNTTNQSLAFIIDNNSQSDRSLSTSQTSIAEVERQSGLVFPVSGDKTLIRVMWESDANELHRAKQDKCN